MNTASKAHGLDGSLVEPDWAPLTFDEVCSVLSRYPRLHNPFRIVSVSPRPLSAASVVETRAQRVFIKRHAKAVRDAEGLREEHHFMAHLRAHGAPVPEVLQTETCDTAVEAGDWCYEVHTVPAGIDVYEEAISWTPFHSRSHARSAGEMLARLHLAAKGFEAPARRNRQLIAGFTIFGADDPAEEFQRYVHARPALRAYLERSGCADEAMDLLMPFHLESAPLLPELAPLWTHNDLHASNMFWSGSGPDARTTAVIDFGLCDRTNAVHDLAHAIERNVIEWLALVNDPAHPESVTVHLDHLLALLEGYEAVRPLSKTEAHALASMLALCHAEFALSEADYFLSVLHSPEKAYMACEGYFLSHARWWRGPGDSTLNTLRSWARTRDAGARA